MELQNWLSKMPYQKMMAFIPVWLKTTQDGHHAVLRSLSKVNTQLRVITAVVSAIIIKKQTNKEQSLMKVLVNVFCVFLSSSLQAWFSPLWRCVKLRCLGTVKSKVICMLLKRVLMFWYYQEWLNVVESSEAKVWKNCISVGKDCLCWKKRVQYHQCHPSGRKCCDEKAIATPFAWTEFSQRTGPGTAIMIANVTVQLPGVMRGKNNSEEVCVS